MTDKTMVLSSARDTRQLGQRLAEVISDGALIAVSGPLGAGKTTLAQGVAAALGVREPVTSPTFTMMHEYHSGRLPFYHLDLYRLHEDEAAVDRAMLQSELEEILSTPSVVLVEWPEYLRSYLREHDCLQVDIEFMEEFAGQTSRADELPRRFGFSAAGPCARRIVESLPGLQFKKRE